MIKKIQHILTLGVIISSLLLPMQYIAGNVANGQMQMQMQKDSDIVVYDDSNSEHYKVLSDSIDDGDNANTLLKPTIHVTIEGTIIDDRIKGGDGNDLINGKEGDDILYGGEGDDEIDGGKGYDEIYGEGGNDQLRGGSGDDKIDGGKGNDILQGEVGDDKIKGGGGADRISGGLGNDQLKGESGDDRIFGGEGDDLIDSGEGNDALLGGRGNDIMIGGFGSDTFICDQFDTIVDFDPYNEGDQIIGSCSVNYLQEQKSENRNNIFPIESELEPEESSKEILQPLQSQTSVSTEASKSLPFSSSRESLNSFDESMLSKDFQRIPPAPMPPVNSFDDIPLPLPKADLQ
jgi:Ca2+-binding RTX toxin-like protein